MFCTLTWSAIHVLLTTVTPTNTQTDGQTDRQMNKQTDKGQADRQMDKHVLVTIPFRYGQLGL